MKCLCVRSSSIIQRLGHKKSALSIAMAFHKNSLIVVWYTFTSIKIRTLTPNNLETLTMTNSNYLPTIAITDKGVLIKKLLLSINAVLT